MRIFVTVFLAFFLLACSDSSGMAPPIGLDGGFDSDSAVIDQDASSVLDASMDTDASSLPDSSILDDAGSDASVPMDASTNQDASVPSAVCGNGVVETSEACDQGMTPNQNCVYGQTACQVCNTSCQLVAGVVVGYCGDSQVNGTEQCDDGNTINTDNCRNNCKWTLYVCGVNQTNSYVSLAAALPPACDENAGYHSFDGNAGNAQALLGLSLNSSFTYNATDGTIDSQTMILNKTLYARKRVCYVYPAMNDSITCVLAPNQP